MKLSRYLIKILFLVLIYLAVDLILNPEKDSIFSNNLFWLICTVSYFIIGTVVMYLFNCSESFKLNLFKKSSLKELFKDISESVLLSLILFICFAFCLFCVFVVVEVFKFFSIYLCFFFIVYVVLFLFYLAKVFKSLIEIFKKN